MKVKVDENMPAALVEALREAGHDTKSVHDEGLSGAEDGPLLQAATQEGRVLMTFDVGFGDVRRYPAGSHAGIVVFRVKDQRWAVLREPATRVLSSGVLDRLQGGLAVVDEDRIRIRLGSDP